VTVGLESRGSENALERSPEIRAFSGDESKSGDNAQRPNWIS
jgi:hypothetical protein